MAPKASPPPKAADDFREGTPIATGWESLRAMWLPAGMPPGLLDELRNAFFAGAQQLFSCVAPMLPPAATMTDADLRRIALIEAELARFIEGYAAKNMTTSGSA